MTAFWGMDTGQARSHADRIEAAVESLAGLREHLDAVVESTAWEGPDAAAFRGRWSSLATTRITAVCEGLTGRSDMISAEADAQDSASDPNSSASGPGGRGASADGSGYRDRDDPRIPNWLENPMERAMSDLAGLVSDRIGWGFETAMDGMIGTADGLGLDPDGLGRFRDDAGHLGGLLGNWATGERVPTIAELAASALLVGGTAVSAPVELFTDTGFLDPRTDVTVHGMAAVQIPSTPQDLADLIIANDQARREMFDGADGGAFDGLSSGQIRIQTVRRADGGTGYIVHAPPTGGAGILSADAWGAQGNSAGWDSDLRSMAGQESAAMADIRAAMRAPGPDGQPLVPPGADVLFVGHSQGGLTAAMLAADPSFNNLSGAPGSYNVTHSFSIGSPVETVVPAQGSTQVTNVAHNPVWKHHSQMPGVPIHPTHIADPVPRLDLEGYRVDGTRVRSPNLREAWLDAPRQTFGEKSSLHNAHDSVLLTSQGVDPTGGYYGSVGQHTDTDPVLSGLQRDLEGQYVGADVTVVSDQVVEVGREDLR